MTLSAQTLVRKAATEDFGQAYGRGRKSSKDRMLLEIRWHSRGGLGAFTAARILAEAALQCGYFAQASPDFGAERQGAPMMVYDRISDGEIKLHCEVYEPVVIVVLDPRLLETQPVTEGLTPNGMLLVNTPKSAAKTEQLIGLHGHILTLDADAIAQDCGCIVQGRLVPNSALLGGLLKLLGDQKMVKAGKARLAGWFRDEALENNSKALSQGARALPFVAGLLGARGV